MPRNLPLLCSLIAAVLALACNGTENEDPAQTPVPVPVDPRPEPPAPGEKGGPPADAPPPVVRPTLSPGEARAIAEAKRKRARDGVVGDGDEPAIVRGSGSAAHDMAGEPVDERPGRLTAEDRRAARDDPARGRLPEPAPGDEAAEDDPAASEKDDPAARPEAPAPSGAPEVPRPGVQVWSGGGMRLVDMAIATRIERRQPVDPAAHFDQVPDLFLCFNAFRNDRDGMSVTHVWRRNGRVLSRVELAVGKSHHWRTWSRQRVKPTWTGKWSCEVVGPGGERLGLAEFTVGKP